MPPLSKIWLAVAVLILLGIGIAFYMFNRTPDSTAPDRFADPERQGIYESGLAACIARASSELEASGASVAESAVQDYCDCAMSRVVEQLTDADIDQYNETEALSDEAMATMNAIAASCSEQYLPQ